MITVSAQSVNYVNWELDILRIGWATPVGSDAERTGVAGGMELRYNISDHTSLGLASEFAGFSTDWANDNLNFDDKAQIMLTWDRYLAKDSPTRPFIGLGAGQMIELERGSSFGIAPRLGLEFGHLRFQAQYSYAVTGDVTDHFSVTAALTLWGGYKGK